MKLVTLYSWLNVTTNTPYYLEDKEKLKSQRANAEECVNVTLTKIELKPYVKKTIPQSLRNAVLGKSTISTLITQHSKPLGRDFIIK